MTTPRTHITMWFALLATLALLCVPAPSAHAAGARTALGAAAAVPDGFVPDWDGGHTDDSQIRFRVLAASDVTVAVIDARGAVRRVLLRERRPAGLVSTIWDGRDSLGRVLPIGRYRVRVLARPVAATTPRGTASAAATLVAGRRDVVVTLRQPPVAVRAVRLSRGSIGKAANLGTTTASFALTTPAFVNAAIVGADGRVWQTLARGRTSQGPHAARWSGTDAIGHPVPDGMYELLVAASGGAKPTLTLRVPVRVDRTLPRITVTPKLTAALHSGDPVLPLDVAVDEPATLRVKLGKRGLRVAAAPGTRKFSIRGATLGIAATKRARVVPIFVSATDRTGNVSAQRVDVTIPAAPLHTTPKPPKFTPPPAGPPITSGKLAWPLHRSILINSPFGPRWGRMHTGIDLEAGIGTPVFAAADGRVSFVGVMSGYGNLVIVDHSNGLQTYYAHLSSTTPGLVVGDPVTRGSGLGLSGCSGTCTGPHLHFEVRVGGASRNPVPYLPTL